MKIGKKYNIISLFNNNHKMYNCLLQGVAASLLESAGVVLFVFEVLPQSKNYTVVWIMNGVFFPILSQIISDFWSCSTEGKRWKIILLILAFVFEVVGVICIIAGKLRQKNVHSYTEAEIYVTPLSLLFLSIAWSHVIQRQQQHSRPGQLAEQVRRIRERNQNSGLDETDPNIVFTQCCSCENVTTGTHPFV